LIDKESTIREWLADPRSSGIIRPVFEQIIARDNDVFDEEEHGGTGVDVMEMIGDMPPVSILGFQQNKWSKPADEIVDDMLKQLHDSIK